ncbi:type VI secretion system tip protein TssI/VgrG [Sorangium sp. So ce176]|uniref:type VI secretion system Vgr family protein n=1 Tax=Sorangium sp. So ce176 TaxID=3133286 RepID=UPI003F624A6E
MKDILSARLESRAFSADAVELHDLTGREVISQPFEFQLHVVCKTPEGLDEEALLAEPAALVFLRGDREERRICGVISVVRDALHTETLHMAYTLTFVPRAFRLTLTETSEIFMDLSVPEVIKKKLERAGLHEGDDFELRLVSTYPPREYVVQYKETDLHFVSRLAEHLGISFFFEHRDGRDVVVFSDANSGFQPVAGDGRAHFYPRGDRIGVYRLEGTTRTVPNRYVVKDYNYRTPHVPLMAAATVSEASGGDIVEYGAHFKTPDEGERIAVIRAEELRAGRRVFEGASDVQVLGAGAKLTLEGHPRGDIELLLVEVRHRLQQATLNAGTGEERAYQNEFRAIPYATTYRPPRVTPKPKVHGVITGVIDAAEKGQYAEVDESGRYRVRFLFDTSSAKDGKASRLIRMAQPHAGAGYGFHFPLRSGVEVILTFIDGDPDRPIIAGAVPNPQTPSTVDAKNARRNVIRTGGGNEINIDDNDGEERIKLSTPFGGATFQLGSPNTPEAGAAITTTEAYTTVANAGVSTLTSVATTLTDIASVVASSSIVQYASAAESFSKALSFKTGQKLVDDVLGIAKSALDIPKKWDAAQQTEANQDVVVAEEHMKRVLAAAQAKAPYSELDPPMLFDRYGVPRAMTKQEWEAQQPEYAEANKATEAYNAAKKKSEDLTKKIAEEEQTRKYAAAGLDMATGLSSGAKGLYEGYKAATELLSSATKKAAKAMSAAQVGIATGMIGAANGFAAVARVPAVIPPIAPPYFLGGGDTSAVLMGKVNAFVGGATSAALSSATTAVVAGGATAHVKSPGIVSIGAGAAALITAKGVIDLLSEGAIKLRSTGYKSRSSGPTNISSGGFMSLTTASSFAATAKGNGKIRANGKIQIQASGNTTIKTSADLQQSASNIEVIASAQAKINGRTSVEVKGSGWGMSAQSGNVSVGSDGDGLQVTGGTVEIKKGASRCTLTGGAAKLSKGSSNVQCSSSKVTVNGSRIDLG